MADGAYVVLGTYASSRKWRILPITLRYPDLRLGKNKKKKKKKSASTSSYGDGDLGTPGSANDVCINATALGSLSTGDLIISEVMVDSVAAADYRGEWFEVYNNSGDVVDIDGLTVNCGGNAGFSVSGTTYINNGEQALFAVRSNSLTNGGMTDVDVEYSYADCSSYYTDSLSITFGSTTFDSVSWTSDFPFSPGSSMTLGTLDASANDSAGNWCAGSSTYGDGDVGTPGDANDSCPLSTSLSSLSTGDLIISEVMVDPAAVSDFRGEWFEIYNNTSDTVELNGLTVNCGNNNGFTVDSYIQVESGEEALFSLNGNSGSNGGLPAIDGLYAYADCSFTYNDSMSIGFSSTTFDSVTWTSDYPFSPGSSMTLGTLDASSNDSSVNFAKPTSSYGNETLGPGDVNDNCPNPALSSSSLGSGDLVISEIMIDPVTVVDFRGEWFEVYNNSGFTVNLNGLTVDSSNNSGFTMIQI